MLLAVNRLKKVPSPSFSICTFEEEQESDHPSLAWVTLRAFAQNERGRNLEKVARGPPVQEFPELIPAPLSSISTTPRDRKKPLYSQTPGPEALALQPAACVSASGIRFGRWIARIR